MSSEYKPQQFLDAQKPEYKLAWSVLQQGPKQSQECGISLFSLRARDKVKPPDIMPSGISRKQWNTASGFRRRADRYFPAVACTSAQGSGLPDFGVP